MDVEFYEKVKREYEPILKRKDNKKAIRYRIRVVERMENGIKKTLFDIRQYITMYLPQGKKKSFLTDVGIYLTKDQMNYLLNCIKDSKDLF